MSGLERVSAKLVTDFDGQKKLVSYNATQGRPIVQTVRTEEEYMDHLGIIVQRDYFPDLTAMKRDSENLPTRKNTSERSNTPAWKQTDAHNPEKLDPSSFSLDKYLANNTTEDDASFAELIEETEKKQRLKLAAFFPAIKDSSESDTNEPKPLALTGGCQVQVGSRLTVTGENAVHFNPPGASHTRDEYLEHLAKDKGIVSSNTRFKRPLPVSLEKRTATKHLLMHKLGHFGLDGKELQSSLSTPNTAGFKFMDTSPSPSPFALGASPLMTWGELDATPYRLDDGTLTPNVISGVPAFHIPSPSQREQLAHRLADKASRQRLRDRNELGKHVHSQSPSRTLLSPAARRLLASSSSIMSSTSGGSRPSSTLTAFAKSPITKTDTPRKDALKLGIVRRPTTGDNNAVCPSPGIQRPTVDTVSVREPSEALTTEFDYKSTQSITDNLLNLRSHSHSSEA